MKKIIAVLLLSYLLPSQLLAEIRVAATTANMGLLAREVGGDRVTVRVLAPPDRDAHYLEARPSMIAAIRRADFLITVGSELEVGWLPAALQVGANPAVLPGRDHHFDGSQYAELRDTDVPADRALGDVHPTGSPHYYLHPEEMVKVAYALAQRLSRLWPDFEDEFTRNAKSFDSAISERTQHWRQRVVDAPAVMLFHKDGDYLMDFLNVEVVGYLEPLPGIPPTARHLRGLIEQNRSKEGRVLFLSYQPPQGPELIKRELGWQIASLRSNVPVDGTVDDYIQLIDSWVAALAN